MYLYHIAQNVGGIKLMNQQNITYNGEENFDEFGDQEILPMTRQTVGLELMKDFTTGHLFHKTYVFQ